MANNEHHAFKPAASAACFQQRAGRSTCSVGINSNMKTTNSPFNLIIARMRARVITVKNMMPSFSGQK
jgi:hypothetical protein